MTRYITVRKFSFFFALALASQQLGAMSAEQAKITEAALKIFDNYKISYVYGGNQIGSDSDCKQCNGCLADKSPKPSERISLCPVCSKCSLDCSHFTNLVFSEVGFFAPYLTSKTMADASGRDLFRKYHLMDMGTEPEVASPGDLLVYRNHVVLLIAKSQANRGDIIHATGGRDLRGPGMGLQLERFVAIAQFRGPLLRILRHKRLIDNAAQLRPKKLRRVVKKSSPQSSAPPLPE